MWFLCNINNVSVNTNSIGLVGVECFLYIKYILFNLWMIGECQAVFAFWEKNTLFVKYVFDFFMYFKAEFICCKTDVKYQLAAEEIKIISFLLK